MILAYLHIEKDGFKQINKFHNVKTVAKQYFSGKSLCREEEKNLVEKIKFSMQQHILLKIFI
jgi:hypothetical protein